MYSVSRQLSGVGGRQPVDGRLLESDAQALLLSCPLSGLLAHSLSCLQNKKPQASLGPSCSSLLITVLAGGSGLSGLVSQDPAPPPSGVKELCKSYTAKMPSQTALHLCNSCTAKMSSQTALHLCNRRCFHRLPSTQP